MVVSGSTAIAEDRAENQREALGKIHEDKFEQWLAMSGKMRYNQL